MAWRRPIASWSQQVEPHGSASQHLASGCQSPFGEAKHPRPSTYGGASSSTGGGNTVNPATSLFEDPIGSIEKSLQRQPGSETADVSNSGAPMLPGALLLVTATVGTYHLVRKPSSSQRLERSTRSEPAVAARYSHRRVSGRARDRLAWRAVKRRRRAVKIALLLPAGEVALRQSFASWSPQTPTAALPFSKSCRIGEASNPGPYTIGGASGSADPRPPGADPRSFRREDPPKGSWGVGEFVAAAEKGDPLKASDFTITGPSHFDDPNWCGHEEEQEGDLQAAFPSSLVEEALLDGEQKAQEDREVRKLFQALDVDVELSSSCRKLSAMAEWELCPAVVEGVVDLPAVAEEGTGFRTAEGWWVSDPLAQERQRQARQREQNLGIEGLLGASCRRQVVAGMPPKKPCPRAEDSMQHRARQRLALLPQKALPFEPRVEEQRGARDDLPTETVSAGSANTDYIYEEETTTTSAHNQGRRRRRGRGRRGPGQAMEDEVAIWTFNSSGAPQLRAAVNHCRRDGGRVPVAILCQEHHAAAEQLPDLQAQIRSMGWKLDAARATATDRGGLSAGVGICTPRWVAAGVTSGASVDCSPVSSPGRIASLWLHQVAPGGICLISCYLHDGEGSSTRNVELLAHALRTAKLSGCPWVLGLDAQQEPKVFLDWAAPMIDRAEGSVVAPNEPTHYPGVGQCRCLDFFIIDRGLAEAVKSLDTLAEFRCASRENDYTVAAKPHRAVRLNLNRSYKPLLLRALKEPRAFPRNKPIGCARKPVTTSTPKVDMIHVSGDRDEDSAAITRAWSCVVKDIEEELSGVCDLAGKARQAYRGRDQEVETVLRPLLPRRAAGPRGVMAQVDYVAVWGWNRLRELLALSELHQKTGSHNPGQERQWINLIRKFCSPTAPTTGAGETRWEDIARTLQRCWSKPAEAVLSLRIACNWAEALVRKQMKLREEKRKESWGRWMKKQASEGGQGGALFRLLKRVEEDPEVIVRCSDGAAASPQAIVNQDFVSWNKLWQKLGSKASQPWRECNGEVDHLCQLPPLSCEALRKAARTFKTTTGVGVDAIVPTQYAWLSDELLGNIGKFLETVEACGCWPDQTKLSIIHLIPKQSGGKRPIGILASIIRLWDRARKHVAEAWRGTCLRDYDWMRTGRGAERSVWAQTVYEEAAAAQGLTTASIFYRSGEGV